MARVVYKGPGQDADSGMLNTTPSLPPSLPPSTTLSHTYSHSLCLTHTLSLSLVFSFCLVSSVVPARPLSLWLLLLHMQYIFTLVLTLYKPCVRACVCVHAHLYKKTHSMMRRGGEGEKEKEEEEEGKKQALRHKSPRAPSPPHSLPPSFPPPPLITCCTYVFFTTPSSPPCLALSPSCPRAGEASKLVCSLSLPLDLSLAAVVCV